MMKKFFTNLFVVGIACIALVACKKGEDEVTYRTSGYFTITGDVKSGYTLYRDYGGILKPDMADVVSKLGSEGFGDEKRIAMTFIFKDENVKETSTGQIIENATLDTSDSGVKIKVIQPIAASEAENAGITAADSLFAVSSLNDMWCYRGYLTTIFYGPVSQKTVDGETAKIFPSLNMVYDVANIEVNKLELTACYNRHSSQESSAAGYYYFYNSFDITEFAPLVPGNDSVVVTVRVKGTDARSVKVARKDFSMGSYEPYK